MAHETKLEFTALAEIHKCLYSDVYQFAGALRTANPFKGTFSPAPVMYLEISAATIGEIIFTHISCQISRDTKTHL